MLTAEPLSVPGSTGLQKEPCGPGGAQASAVARVVVVEDHPLFLDALVGRLERLGFAVCAALVDAEQLLEAFANHQPDIVLLDLNLPGLSGDRLTVRLLAAYPEARVVILSAYDDARSVRRCLDAGAVGFITKRVTASELDSCLRAACQGEQVFDQRSALTAIRALRSGESTGKLTERETDILHMVADGRSTADIAQQLHLSPFTVKTHVAKIFDRLGVTDRAAAVAFALREGLIS